MVFLDSSIFKGNVIQAPSAMTAFDHVLVMLSANFISETWVPTKAVSIAVTIHLSAWLSGFLLSLSGRRETLCWSKKSTQCSLETHIGVLFTGRLGDVGLR